MKKPSIIIQWILTVFFLMSSFAFGIKVCTIFFLIAAVFTAPIKGIREFLKTNLKLKNWLIVVIVIASTVIGCLTIPSVDENIEETTTENTTIVETTAETTTEATTTITTTTEKATEETTKSSISLDDIPAFSDDAYISINDNKPKFSDSDKKRKKDYENYSSLDYLGRCGVAFACVCKDTMPTEKRGEIGSVKPTGWHTVKYDCVDGKYLYNRCHLIGYQLTAENANTKNLITGTRYLNIEGMLPFENMVADYVDETNNHVLYRVTPIFKGDELVARGVQMEAYSVEDKGEGISFNVYCYNNQPNVKIDYKTGESQLKNGSTSKTTTTKKSTDNSESTYILNTNTKKFHKPSCQYADQIKSSNKKTFKGKRNELIDDGYAPCKVCNP